MVNFYNFICSGRTKEINKNLTQTMAMVEQYMEILTAEESELEKQ